LTCGGKKVPVTIDWPRIVVRWIAWMSIAWYSAWRTRRSFNGLRPRTSL
jgi:hypothetical protein